MKSIEQLNEINSVIIGKAIEVHNALGTGLLESTYRDCLHYELLNTGLKVEKEKILPLMYKTLKIEAAYKMDLLVDDNIVLELKAVDKIIDVHKAQLLTYLKHGNYKLGLLINFNVLLLKDGITRVINNK